MNAYQMYNESWEAFKKAKLSTTHDVVKSVNNLAKGLAGVKRWKHALVKIPVKAAASLTVGAVGFGLTAATNIPGFGAVLSIPVDPIVDKVTDKIIEAWAKSDADVQGKTKLQSGFSFKANKTGEQAMDDLPKHIAQLVSAHREYYSQCTKLAKKLIKAKDKGAEPEEINEILKSLFMSFHAMRWATIKVSHDAQLIRGALAQVEALIEESKNWIGDEGVRMITATAPYFEETEE